MSPLEESTPTDSEKKDVSSVVLIIANVVPLLGVLFWNWSTLNVVVLYWLENVIVGAINILKMLTCAPDPDKIDIMGKIKHRLAGREKDLSEEDAGKLRAFEKMIETNEGKIAWLNHGTKLFIVPFFILHYGLFCLVHGVFVFVILGGSTGPNRFLRGGPSVDGFMDLVGAAVANGGIWAALALTASHLFSFFVNYLGKGEYQRTAVPFLMMAPYGRIVVLHVAILFGAFASVMLGSPLLLLVLLIVGKMILDLKLHQRAHRSLAVGLR